LIKPLTTDEWVDLGAEFAVVRLINQDGSIDGVGVRNLRNAMEANMTELSGYMYPCVQSSYFARVSGITCLDPAEQITTLVAALEENVAKLEEYETVTWVPTSAPTGSPTVAAQPTYEPTSSPSSGPTILATALPSSSPSEPPSEMPSSTPTALHVNWTVAPTMEPTSRAPTFSPTQHPTYSQHPTSQPTNVPGQDELIVRRIFLIVEDESPPRYYDPDQSVNQAYFKELQYTAHSYGYQLGIYTTKRYWEELMVTVSGNALTFERESTPLWVPRYDGLADMDFFVPFGNWTWPYMKQYEGGSSAARRAPYTWRINENYIDETFYDLDGLNGTIIAAPIYP
jgi:hypothetical protein